MAMEQTLINVYEVVSVASFSLTLLWGKFTQMAQYVIRGVLLKNEMHVKPKELPNIHTACPHPSISDSAGLGKGLSVWLLTSSKWCCYQDHTGIPKLELS